jgi:hypothetical protein
MTHSVKKMISWEEFRDMCEDRAGWPRNKERKEVPAETDGALYDCHNDAHSAYVEELGVDYCRCVSKTCPRWLRLDMKE